jgi:hypothetical protein
MAISAEKSELLSGGAGEAFAHDSGKTRLNEAVTQFIADKDEWQMHDALVSLIEKGQLELADEPLRIDPRAVWEPCRVSDPQIAEALLVLGGCAKVAANAIMV